MPAHTQLDMQPDISLHAPSMLAGPRAHTSRVRVSKLARCAQAGGPPRLMLGWAVGWQPSWTAPWMRAWSQPWPLCWAPAAQALGRRRAVNARRWAAVLHLLVWDRLAEPCGRPVSMKSRLAHLPALYGNICAWLTPARCRKLTLHITPPSSEMLQAALRARAGASLLARCMARWRAGGQRCAGACAVSGAHAGQGCGHA